MTALTFPNIPAHVESPGQKVEFKLLSATFGDGYEQISQEGLNSKKEEWSLTWSNEDGTDTTTIKTFLDARGGSEPFYWTAPNDTAKLWRCEGYSSKPTSPMTETVSAVFKRWYGPA